MILRRNPRGMWRHSWCCFVIFSWCHASLLMFLFFFFSWWLLMRLVVTGLRVERYHSFSPGWLDFVLFWLLFARKLWRLWLWEMCWLSEASGVWVQGNWQNRVSFRGSSLTVGYCGIHGTGQPAFTLYVAYSVFDDFFTPTSSLWALNK